MSKIVACSVDGCERPTKYRGFCYAHYQSLRASGDLQNLVRPSALERFTARVDKDGPLPTWAPFLGPCWIWTGSREAGGYGRFGFGGRGKTGPAHRWSYSHFVGPIPDGLHIDHLCRVRCCVNPAHLEAVTQRENNLRGMSPFAKRARQTHCKRGHEFTPENTIREARGTRRCRACDNAADRARRRRPT